MTVWYVFLAIGMCGLLLGMAMLRNALRCVFDEEQLYR